MKCNTETYYMDFTEIYPRKNCVQGCNCNFVQKWYNFPTSKNNLGRSMNLVFEKCSV